METPNGKNFDQLGHLSHINLQRRQVKSDTEKI